jgi:dephospho-CoA kinase
MPAIGITGGISAGKTTFVKYLRELLPDAKFFDADAMARELTHHDQNVLAEIRKKFGDDIFDANGQLNRSALRAMVFRAPEKRRELEQILHPPIRRHWSREAEKHGQSNEYFFADIPLLYETGGEKLCDRVVVVACSPSVQLARLRMRYGLEGGLRRGASPPAWKPYGQEAGAERAPATPGSLELAPPGLEEVERLMVEMINSQLPLAEKVKRADHVVWNNGPESVLAEQVRFLRNLWTGK